MKNKFYNKVKQVGKDIIGTIAKHKKESALVLLVGTAIGLQKCAKTEYEYSGMVEQDSVKFEKKVALTGCSGSSLTFYKPDGSKIILWADYDGNLKFERLQVIEKGFGGRKNYYNIYQAKVGKYVVEGWQTKADSVLPKILKIKPDQRAQEKERQAQIKYGLRHLK